jgi:hypothetical protein
MGTHKGTRENLGLHMAPIAGAQVREEQAGLDQRVDNLRAIHGEPWVQLLDHRDVIRDDVVTSKDPLVRHLLKIVHTKVYVLRPIAEAFPCLEVFHGDAMDFRYVLQESIGLQIEQGSPHTVPLFTPLRGDSVCDSRECPGAFLPAIRAWRHHVNPSLAAFHNVRRDQLRKTLEPQAGSLGFPMPEHPRLDHLVRLTDTAGDDADGVLNGDLGDRSIHEVLNELEAFLLVLATIWVARVGSSFRGRKVFVFRVIQPANASYSQVGAGRVSDHEVPSIIDNVFDIPLIVRAFDLGRQKVTTHGFVA